MVSKELGPAEQGTLGDGAEHFQSDYPSEGTRTLGHLLIDFRDINSTLLLVPSLG